MGEEAFLLWEPHAGYGNLSRDLILVMSPIYREAFPYFHDVESRLQAGFFRHIAGIVCSCLTDINEGNWFRDFLISLNDNQRADWAREMEGALRGSSEVRRAQVWQRWMKNYWELRVHGTPCPLLPKEAEKMLGWAFAIGQAFPEAVDLVVQGPRVEQKLGIVLHTLKEHEAPESHPESLLQLLEWLLRDHSSQWMISKDIEPLLFRLPKKKQSLPLLNRICQHLASLGYAGAADLKRRIEENFTED
jgi:hypothetical protein